MAIGLSNVAVCHPLAVSFENVTVASSVPVLLHSEPKLQRLSAQGGIELKSPIAFLRNAVRPIAAFDYASREENHWREELSGAAGIQLENPALSKMRVQILATYYKGNSRNGQFFLDRIESLGVGVHFHF